MTSTSTPSITLSSNPLGGTYDQRRRAGRELRRSVPLAAHGDWTPAPARREPVGILEETNRTRLPDLVPVRYGRMLASPFAFFRGAAAVMAEDLASSPVTDVRLQACGDAHIGNFGVFGSPERNLVFDVNDFDETLPAPWEWDIKRLAVSVALAARNLQITGQACQASVIDSVRAYREGMRALARLGPLDVWYDRIDVKQVLAIAAERRAKELRHALREDKIRQRTALRVLPKLTRVVNGSWRIIDNPPLIVHENPEAFDAERVLTAYAASLAPDRRPLLERYTVVDAVRKVVGVGSVGTRCYLALLVDSDHRAPIFLQLKEAVQSALTRTAGRSQYEHQGMRVVVGQRLMQAASDIFLGWTGDGAHDYYVRQFRDMKGSVNLDVMTPRGLASYASVCGRTLARAHARSGDSALIGGYLGRRDAFDQAVATFALAYADQTEQDYETLVEAVKTGRITASPGR